MGGKDAHPTTNLMFCGTGIFPVLLVSRCADESLCRSDFNRRLKPPKFYSITPPQQPELSPQLDLTQPNEKP
jgi:hypothetical protein